MNVSYSFRFLCSSVFLEKWSEILAWFYYLYSDCFRRLGSHYETEQCGGEIVFTGSVAEVRYNKQLLEQYLAVWEFNYLLKKEHGWNSVAHQNIWEGFGKSALRSPLFEQLAILSSNPCFVAFLRLHALNALQRMVWCRIFSFSIPWTNLLGSNFSSIASLTCRRSSRTWIFTVIILFLCINIILVIKNNTKFFSTNQEFRLFDSTSIIITGPTASGKSDLALEHAKKLMARSSVQTLCRFTAVWILGLKPTTEQLTVPHHQIDLCNLDEHYSAGQYARDAEIALNKMGELGKIPILVGGSGLYYKALIYGLDEMPPIPEAIRCSVLNDWKIRGFEKCYQELAKCDPELASRLSPRDAIRVQRGLEVIRATQKKISYFHVS